MSWASTAAEPPRPARPGIGRSVRRLAAALPVPALLVALVAWGLYLPTAARVVQLSPDMVEFVDVARRVAAGEGYVLGIKAYHLGGPEVLHDGLIHRPPLFTLLMAGLLRLGAGLPAVQVVNALFGAFSAALVCSIGTRLAGRTVGIAAGLLAALSPIALEQTVQLLSDPLATVLTLAAVRLTMAAGERLSTRPTLLTSLLAGLLFGLGYLARPPVLVVWLAVLAVLLVRARRQPEVRLALGGLLAGAVLVCGPATLWSVLALGRLTYSGKGYLYGVVSDADVMENGYASLPLSPVAFVLADPGFVAGAIGSVAALYARSLFLETSGLAPLAAGWPAALLAVARGRYPWTAWIALAVAGANLLYYSLTWSTWQDRFLLTTLYLLLPFAVDGLERTFRGAVALLAARSGPGAAACRAAVVSAISTVALGVVLAGVAALWLPRFVDQWRGQFRYGERPAGTRVDYGVRWSGPPRWVNDRSLEEALEWILTRTEHDDVLAHGQPWPYSFFTGRPSVLLPYRLDDAQLRRFLVEYRVAYVLYDPRDPQRRDYLEQLRALGDAGVRSQRVETLIVFDTRPLWRTP